MGASDPLDNLPRQGEAYSPYKTDIHLPLSFGGLMKAQYCLLEKFNNYFNRKLALYSNLEDYVSHSASSFIPTNSDGEYSLFDFNPHDNITTEITVNDASADYDYFLLLDDDHNILSRWYVMEQKRNRMGQWVYYLRRDVLADKYTDILTAPLFVEKGVVTDPTSPLLLNNEDVKVNQIKKEEVLLKDISECPWLVMYLKKGVLGNNTIGPDSDGSFTIDIPIESDNVYETLSTPIASWQYYTYTANDYVLSTEVNTNIYLDFDDGIIDAYGQRYSVNLLATTLSSYVYGRQVRSSNLTTDLLDFQTRLDGQIFPRRSVIYPLVMSAFSLNASNPLQRYDGKIIKDSDGKYFMVRIRENGMGNAEMDVTDVSAPAVKDFLKNCWNYGLDQSVEPDNMAFTVSHKYKNYRIELEEIKAISTVVRMGDYTGPGTVDSMLFDVICMPFGKMTVSASGGINLLTSQDRSLKVMSALATALTSQYVLDLQLLPYCPLQNLLTSNKLTITTINKQALAGIYSGNTTDLFAVANYANFTFDIAKTITAPSLGITVPSSYVTKYVNDCTMLRLCSPNYNGVFEMNLAKNGGQIDGFNVDVTLRPFNPYIHVNPYFAFVYGEDFNDVRGLVCGGDFSLGILDDQWNVYEIQNKNYQAIFDRQIQNMDVNNAIARQESLFGAVAGVGAGVAGGAVAGMMSGAGPIGGLLGGAFSAVGGVMDYQNLLRRQEENRNYAIDNYNLTLGNIKALPYSITRTSALTYNNKYFPFVEIYDCTDVEKRAYVDKLKYNGMNIGIIDQMKPYISTDNSNYFRARMIRNLDIPEDYHFMATINEELMKGVYI